MLILERVAEQAKHAKGDEEEDSEDGDQDDDDDDLDLDGLVDAEKIDNLDDVSLPKAFATILPLPRGIISVGVPHLTY